MSLQVILISQLPLPYFKIGRWTILYHNYLTQKHQIDFLVCEKPIERYKNLNYSVVKNNFWLNFVQKITKNNFLKYQIALNNIIDKDEKYIVQIIDNSGLAKNIHKYLLKNHNRKNFYIQYFYHGFMPIQSVNSSLNFYDNVDELVLLTQLSYNRLKNDIDVLIPKVSILHNGIDTNKFFKIDSFRKNQIKNSLDFNDLKIFIWCSQDRPKKGLHIVLEAWKTIHANYPKTILLVIGCEPKEPQVGVKFLGKIPNNDLPKYYQIADVYLFPTLWQEGFGLSLIEALHCGCYCIASAMGGVPEVLNFGKYGVLIKNPNIVQDWILEMKLYLENQNQVFNFPNAIYTTEIWNNEMNKIIENAKNSFV